MFPFNFEIHRRIVMIIRNKGSGKETRFLYPRNKMAVQYWTFYIILTESQISEFQVMSKKYLVTWVRFVLAVQ